MSEYFYTLTLQWQQDGSPHYGLSSGTVQVPEGETEESVFTTLRLNACKRHGAPSESSAVINYYLARNEL